MGTKTKTKHDANLGHTEFRLYSVGSGKRGEEKLTN